MSALGYLVLLVCVSGGVFAQKTASSMGVGTQHCRLCDNLATCQFKGQNAANQLEFECVCPIGYSGDGLTCSGINPCDAGLDTCDTDATCQSLGGTRFTCKCKPGFIGDGYTCKDQNECTQPNLCDPTNSICVNTIGSFECICKSGYVHPVTNGVEDKATCVDRDECSQPQFACPANSVCLNTVGSYSCDCESGFVKSSNGLFCADLDECSQLTPHPCGSNSNCINLSPGFECSCQAGYMHPNATDKVNCVDINECLDTNFHQCPPNSQCINSVGSYQCACDSGYQKTADGKFCEDRKECSAAINPCDENRSVCVDTVGGYECACNPGYSHFTADKKICADDNECTMGTANCSKYSTCENTEGSYKCNCFYGYEWDGQTCTEVTPSLVDLQSNIDNLSNTQLTLKMHVGYFENIHLRTQLEKVKRLCPLKQAGLLPANIRAKRDITSDLKELTAGDEAQRRLTLQTLLHTNSELSLQIALLKKSCDLN